MYFAGGAIITKTFVVGMMAGMLLLRKIEKKVKEIKAEREMRKEN